MQDKMQSQQVATLIALKKGFPHCCLRALFLGLFKLSFLDFRAK